MSDSDQTAQQREFQCPSCNSRIVIPYSLPETTGPCPKCQAMITSPPPPEKHPLSPLPTFPAEYSEHPANQPEEPSRAVLPPRREPIQKEIKETNDPEESSPVDSRSPDKSKSGIIPAMIGLLILIFAGGAGVIFLVERMSNGIASPKSTKSDEDAEIREANYLRIGWQKDAYEVLENYIEGTSVEEKLPHIHRPEVLDSKMENFYGGVVINDSDTPAQSFSVYELPMQDRKRGIFFLTYDQPPQFALKDFFRPLATLEVQYGIDEADLLLTTMARVRNFSMDPVRVHAFFKRTETGLKLDWEVFAQTKYRLFKNFIELPDPGANEVFRVLVSEDVPDKGQGMTGTRTYRLVDPANLEDWVRINVKVDSETGKALSSINWRGSKQTTPTTRGATVELQWIDKGKIERPELSINRFICWEFLGLGGREVTTTTLSD